MGRTVRRHRTEIIAEGSQSRYFFEVTARSDAVSRRGRAACPPGAAKREGGACPSDLRVFSGVSDSGSARPEPRFSAASSPSRSRSRSPGAAGNFRAPVSRSLPSLSACGPDFPMGISISCQACQKPVTPRFASALERAAGTAADRAADPAWVGWAALETAWDWAAWPCKMSLAGPWRRCWTWRFPLRSVPVKPLAFPEVPPRRIRKQPRQTRHVRHEFL